MQYVESETATDREVRRKEVEYITAFRSNDPAIGYNRWPNLKPQPPGEEGEETVGNGLQE